MNDPIEIREISAAQTRPVRQRVLRPNQRAEELVYPGDDDKDTFHLGAMSAKNEVVAILSMYFDPRPDTNEPGWRIRGMASVPEVQGTGMGRKLVEHARGGRGPGGVGVHDRGDVGAVGVDAEV